jgi:hypothetical protein
LLLLVVAVVVAVLVVAVAQEVLELELHLRFLQGKLIRLLSGLVVQEKALEVTVKEAMEQILRLAQLHQTVEVAEPQAKVARVPQGQDAQAGLAAVAVGIKMLC